MADSFTVKTVSETKHHHELEFSLTSSLSKSKKTVNNPAPNKEGVNHLSTIEAPSQSINDEVAPLDYIMDIAVKSYHRKWISGQTSQRCD